MSDISIFRERIWPILFMFLVTVIFISIVSGIYLATKETVAENETLFLKRSVLFAADIEVPETNAEIQELFNQRVVERNVTGGVAEYFEVTGPDGSGVQAYVVPWTGAGLWGDIDSVVGFEPDLNTLTGIDFTYQNETPGLGGRIVEDWYRNQFRGKQGPVEYDTDGEEGTAVGPNAIDAVTGATNTSLGVKNLVNELYGQAASIIRGGN